MTMPRRESVVLRSIETIGLVISLPVHHLSVSHEHHQKTKIENKSDIARLHAFLITNVQIQLIRLNVYFLVEYLP